MMQNCSIIGELTLTDEVAAKLQAQNGDGRSLSMDFISADQDDGLSAENSVLLENMMEIREGTCLHTACNTAKETGGETNGQKSRSKKELRKCWSIFPARNSCRNYMSNLVSKEPMLTTAMRKKILFTVSIPRAAFSCFRASRITLSSARRYEQNLRRNKRKELYDGT